jgi:hypothetical protein
MLVSGRETQNVTRTRFCVRLFRFQGAIDTGVSGTQIARRRIRRCLAKASRGYCPQRQVFTLPGWSRSVNPHGPDFSASSKPCGRVRAFERWVTLPAAPRLRAGRRCEPRHTPTSCMRRPLHLHAQRRSIRRKWPGGAVSYPVARGRRPRRRASQDPRHRSPSRR